MNVSGMLYIVYNENELLLKIKGVISFPKWFKGKRNFFCNATLWSEYL